MVDSIVTIPLPGQISGSGSRTKGRRPRPIHSPNFIAGPENRLAVAAVRSFLHDARREYNPLLLHGPSGTGKTLLANGLADHWRRDASRGPVVVTRAIDFARQWADAVQTHAIDDFQTQHRTAGLLVFEDIGHLVIERPKKDIQKQLAQEEFLHTLDALVAAQRQVIVTASVAPGWLTGMIGPLRSRLVAGLIVPLTPPGPETRAAIIRHTAEQIPVRISPAATRILAKGLQGTAGRLKAALMELGMASDTSRRPIDAAAAQQYLARQTTRTEPSLSEIAKATARSFSLTLSDLRSASRQRRIVTARNVAIWLARHFTSASLQKIGKYFGGRDHSTIMYGHRKTEDLLKRDPAIRDIVAQLQEQLQNE